MICWCFAHGGSSARGDAATLLRSSMRERALLGRMVCASRLGVPASRASWPRSSGFVQGDTVRRRIAGYRDDEAAGCRSGEISVAAALPSCRHAPPPAYVIASRRPGIRWWPSRQTRGGRGLRAGTQQHATCCAEGIVRSRARNCVERNHQQGRARRARPFLQSASRKSRLRVLDKAAHWTLDEAIALSFGKAPEQVSWEKLEPLVHISRFAFEYQRRRELALRACQWEQLFDPVLPGVFLAWARRTGLTIPPELEAAVAAHGISGSPTGSRCLTSLRRAPTSNTRS